MDNLLKECLDYLKGLNLSNDDKFRLLQYLFALSPNLASELAKIEVTHTDYINYISGIKQKV